MSDATALPDLDRIRPPRQARSRKAFEAALDAFDALLREEPYARVTMDQVAKRAGLSITSVYGRFDGKAALVLALHERAIQQGLSRLDAVLADPDDAEKPLEVVVPKWIDALVRFTSGESHVFRAVLASADDETSQRAAAFIRAASERVGAAVAGRSSRPRREVERDVDFAWRSVVAVLQQQWMLWGAEPSRFPLSRKALVRRLTRAFLAAIDV